MILKIKKFLTVVGLVGATVLFASAPAYALHDIGASGTPSTSSTTTASADNSTTDPCHPEKWTPKGVALTPKQATSCEACNKKNPNVNAQAQVCLQNNIIVQDLNKIIDGLAGLVGVVAVAMIIVGGIQYSLARNNPQSVTNARTRIINAVVALIAFMLIWGLLQYLVPGGVFNS